MIGIQRGAVSPAVAAAVSVLTPVLPCAGRVRAGLRAVAPRLSEAELEAWVSALEKPLAAAGITSPRCLASFLGQCSVESGGFRVLEEDLRYSAVRLCQVWPSHFPDLESTEGCASRPESLANRVYAHRMGNGDEASGDGWRFRGRGLIQITGRTNYQRFARAMGLTLDHAVERAGMPAGAVESAVWFWTVNQLNPLAAVWSIDLLTRKINGGLSGAVERSRLCEAALQAIGA